MARSAIDATVGVPENPRGAVVALGAPTPPSVFGIVSLLRTFGTAVTG